MASKTLFELQHNFPKLAEESGFTFNTHKPRVRVEWNKIRLIDIETLIRDRKFVLIEQYLKDILDCVLESEFDVRILDEGVLKMFRLAQLTIEYQQFCRHYLDRSVSVLREEITALAQELDHVKRALREKEEEIRRYKRKAKYNYRGQLPYGNDNIANMILQTLANKSDLFPSAAQSEHAHYNKCTYCDKVFMNQLYLRSHLARRHSNMTELPNKDPPLEQQELIRPQNDNHLDLQNEIVELKSKLKNMEVFLKLVNTKPELNLEVTKTGIEDIVSNKMININANDTAPQKEMKDAQVSTYDENYILDKIEEWKKEEYEKYNKEICLLRTQISNIIESSKETIPIKSTHNDNKLMEQLHETIKQQSVEISSLKEELKKSRVKSNEEANIKKEIEAKMAFWAERTEIQSKEYNLLLQKLDNVAKEAKESRERADLEKGRAMKLQILLEQQINGQNNVNNNESFGNTKIKRKCEQIVRLMVCELPATVPPRTCSDDPYLCQNSDQENKECELLEDKIKSPKKSNPTPDRKTLEKLQRRAQELLNQSITSSETSSASDKITLPVNKKKTELNKTTKKVKGESSSKNLQKSGKCKPIENGILQNKTNHSQLREKQNFDFHTNKSTSKQVNGSVYSHGSPSKIIRAKITEEVNQRLVSLGVDPLKRRLPRDIFQKHRVHLQENNEVKSKKNAEREKIYHSIISYLDNKATIKNKQHRRIEENDYISPSRSGKPFSFTSVISNVKSKALSLVKTNEGFKKENDKKLQESVTKKALTLLKTPPETPSSSPITKRKSIKELTPNNYGNEKKELNEKSVYGNMMRKKPEASDESDTDTSESIPLTSTKILIDSYENNKIRRPSTSSSTYEFKVDEKKKNNKAVFEQAKNVINAFENTYIQQVSQKSEDNNDITSVQENELRYAASDENVNSQKQTKGVLKNASSMSSLYKKKVIFDMDAIQMKSVSASPSQSVTDKSDKDEKYGLGIINLDTEEWDVSSIENEPIGDEKEKKIISRTSPKIAELKESIEAQLTRRNQSLSTALVGGVDVLKGPTLTKPSSLGGSNTSLGSSILDESDSALRNNHAAYIKPKNITEKDDSEIDISELIVGDNNNKF